MIRSLRLVRNVGQFDSVSAGTNLPMERITLLYAENGRGKTTLSAIFRSLASGEALPILERVGSKYSIRRLTCGFPGRRRGGGTRGRRLDQTRSSSLTDGRTRHTDAL